MRVTRGIGLFAALLLAGCGGGQADETEAASPAPSVSASPPAASPTTVAEQVEAAVAEYKEIGYDASNYYADYDPAGNYLRWGQMKTFRESDVIQLDAKGLPKVKYGDEYAYNPVTMSHFTLAAHGRLVTGDDTARRAMVDGADKLMSLQGDDGAFRYDFPYQYYLLEEPYKPGWVSGMAQGNAMSALVRVFDATGDRKYRAAAERAYDFLTVPISEGGTATTLEDADRGDGVFFEEYVATPNTYTLNGYMFTLLGIYDLADATGDRGVAATFDEGVESLVTMLPMYDVGGFSAYDLGHVTHNADHPHVVTRYHTVHLYLLRALESVTDAPELRETREKWESYVA